MASTPSAAAFIELRDEVAGQEMPERPLVLAGKVEDIEADGADLVTRCMASLHHLFIRRDLNGKPGFCRHQAGIGKVPIGSGLGYASLFRGPLHGHGFAI